MGNSARCKSSPFNKFIGVKMNVLSLFDGISCGMIALERAGIKVDNYFASEIKSIAIKCSKANYPKIRQIGDVTKIHYQDGKLYTEKGKGKVKIDLLIGGSPCQDFSVLQGFNKNFKNYGLKGSKSKLFYEYLRLKEEINPKYFLLENVKMKKDSENQLNNYLGVKGLHIDSRLVSFQKRHRIYWTNIKGVDIPKDKNINFQDYKDYNETRLEEARTNKTPSRIRMWADGRGAIVWELVKILQINQKLIV